jgi:hypothetical protein
MRTWMKWTSLAAFGLLASTALAADHGDGTETAGDADADITDVYSWVKNDNDTVVLMMNIVGDFSDSVHYAFHVGRSADALTAVTAASTGGTDVICEFDAAGMISCWVGADGYVTGDASPNAGITSDDGSIRVHAGEHADPFYFYLDGFSTAIGTAVAADGLLPNGIAGLADAAGCPDLSPPVTAVIPASLCPDTGMNAVSVAILLAGMLNGTYADTDCTPPPNGAVNNFEQLNVRSLVLEIPASMIGGTGDFVQVHASTHAKAGS